MLKPENKPSEALRSKKKGAPRSGGYLFLSVAKPVRGYRGALPPDGGQQPFKNCDDGRVHKTGNVLPNIMRAMQAVFSSVSSLKAVAICLVFKCNLLSFLPPSNTSPFTAKSGTKLKNCWGKN